MHTYIHTYMHSYIQTYLLTYIHTYSHTYIHAYIHTHKHTHTYKSIGYLCSNQDTEARQISCGPTGAVLPISLADKCRALGHRSQPRTERFFQQRPHISAEIRKPYPPKRITKKNKIKEENMRR